MLKSGLGLWWHRCKPSANFVVNIHKHMSAHAFGALCASWPLWHIWLVILPALFSCGCSSSLSRQFIPRLLSFSRCCPCTGENPSQEKNSQRWNRSMLALTSKRARHSQEKVLEMICQLFFFFHQGSLGRCHGVAALALTDTLLPALWKHLRARWIYLLLHCFSLQIWQLIIPLVPDSPLFSNW